MFVFVVIVAVGIVLDYLLRPAIYYYFRAFKIVENIPTLPPVPLLGHALYFYKAKTPNDVLKLISQGLHSTPCKIAKAWVAPKIFIGLLNPKHIEIVLSSKDALDKDSLYKMLRIFGTGLFTENGRKWKELRKPLNRLLSKKALESYFHVFQDSAVKFCKYLEYYASTGEELDLRHAIGNYSMDGLSASTFGYETNEISNSLSTIGKDTEDISSLVVRMMLKPHYFFFPSLMYFESEGRQFIKLSKRMRSFVGDMLQGRINQIASSNKDYDDTKPNYYSDVLIEKAKEYGLSHEKLAHLATDYIIAGFDAPALISAATLLMLAMFPEHEEAVYREQIEILGEGISVMPSENDLAKMCYLDRVIKETQRIFSAMAILRSVKEDITLDDQFTLPKGCTAYISIYDLHRDPSNWSHPHEFYPDHFLPEEIARRPKGTYLPFSWGPRACPGSLFANIVMKVLLSRIIREYKFQTDKKFKNLQFKCSLLMEPADGFTMKVTRRNKPTNRNQKK